MLGMECLDEMPPLQRKSSSISTEYSIADSCSSADENTDTLNELTDMLIENNFNSASFTGLLFEELVTNASELIQDDVKSDSDSGYLTSPTALSDDSSLDSWLLNSVSSTESGSTQTLPSIHSIMQPSHSGYTDVSYSVMRSKFGANFNQNVGDFSKPLSAINMTSLPAHTPAANQIVPEPIKIKDEPIDTYEEFINEITNKGVYGEQNAQTNNIIAHTQELSIGAGNNPDLAQLDMLSSDEIKQEEADELFRLKFSPHVLPPCRVCGAQATGYHYGANTCEPCKGFYHRMIKRADRNPVCLKEGKCLITSKNRGACPACRFQKCIEAGMCKENIKTGRYSYSKRSRDIIELQHSIKKKRQAKSLQQQQQEHAHQYVLNQSTLPSQPQRLNQKLEEKIQVDSDPTSQHILSTLRAARDKIVGKMLQANYTLSSNELQRIRNFTQSGACTNAAAYDVFLQWLHNGFKHNFWSSYIKAIPGFKNLSMQDQISIIKKSFVDFWAVSRHRHFDVENGEFHSVSGAVIQLTEILGEHQSSSLFKAVKRLQNLRLSVDEGCMLSALVVLNIDSSNMQNPQAVEEIKSNLLNGLIYALKLQRPKPLATFAQIISALTELKSGSYKMSNLAIFPEDVTPPLFREVVLEMDS